MKTQNNSSRYSRTKSILLILLSIFSIALVIVFISVAIQRNNKNQLLQDAKLAFEKGNFADAKKKFSDYLRMDANHEGAVEKLAQIYEKEGRYRIASEFWAVAASLNTFEKKYLESEIACLAQCRDFKHLLLKWKNLPETDRKTPYYTALEAFASLNLEGKQNAGKNIGQLPSGTHQKPLVNYVAFLMKSDHLSSTERIARLRPWTQSKDFVVALDAMLKCAQLSYTTRNFFLAEKMLQNAVALNGEHATVLLADFYGRSNRLEQAVEMYQKAQTYGMTPYHAVFFGEALAKLNRLPELKTLASHYTGGSQVMLLTGYYLDSLIAYKEKNYKQLADNLKLVNGKIDTPFALLISLDSALRAEDLKQSTELLASMKKRPDCIEYMPFCVIQVMPVLEKFYLKGDVASVSAIAALFYDPKHPNLLLSRILLKDAFLKNALSEKELDLTLKKFPEDADLLNIAALHARKRGAFADMLKYAVQNEKKHPEALSVQIQKAIALEGLNRMDEADACYGKLTAAHPEDSQLLKMYLLFAIRQNKEKYLHSVKKILEKNQDPALEAYLPLMDAEISVLRKDTPKALEKLKTAYEKLPTEIRNPEEMDLVYRIAYLSAKLDLVDQAIQAYLSIIKVLPNSIPVQLNLSELYAVKGDRTKSLEFARQAWRQNSELPFTQTCYGMRLFESGNFSESLRVLTPLMRGKNVESRIRNAWKKAMEQQMDADFKDKKFEKCKERAGEFLRYFPGDRIGMEYRKKAQNALVEKDKSK